MKLKEKQRERHLGDPFPFPSKTGNMLAKPAISTAKLQWLLCWQMAFEKELHVQ